MRIYKFKNSNYSKGSKRKNHKLIRKRAAINNFLKQTTSIAKSPNAVKNKQRGFSQQSTKLKE